MSDIVNYIFFLLFITGKSCEGASVCPDYQETAELCLEGSGATGSLSDVPLDDGDIRAICRLDGLMTWFSVPEPADHRTATYRMVQSCRKSRDSADSFAECEEIDLNDIVTELVSLLPVTSVTSNVTYYNSYCFWCSADPGPGAIWSLNISCSQWTALQPSRSEQEIIAAAMKSPFCWIRLQPPPGVFPQTCTTPALTSAQPAAAAAATTTATTRSTATTGTADNHTQAAAEGKETLPVPTLSLLLNFQGEGGTGSDGSASDGGERARDEDQESAMCSPGQFHEKIKNRCMRLECASGKRLRKQQCHSFIQRAKGLSYRVALSVDVFVTPPDVTHNYVTLPFTPPPSLEKVVEAAVQERLTLLHTSAYILKGVVVDDFGDVTDIADVSAEDKQDVFFDGEHAQFVSASTYNRVRPKGKKNVGQDEGLLWGRVEMWLNFIVTSEADHQEVELSALEMTRNDLYVKCNERYLRLSPKLTNGYADKTRPLDDSVAFSASSKSFRTVVQHPDYVALLALPDRVDVTVSPFLFCPYLTFPAEDFHVNRTGQREVKVTLLNVTFSLTDAGVETDNYGRLRICKETFVDILQRSAANKDGRDFQHAANEGRRADLVQSLQHYVSQVSVSVSLLGLFFTFLTFATFKDMRTLPGQNVMALCANLFLAQGFLQFGAHRTEHPGVCVAIGMAVHYFWLAAALWMHACSHYTHHVVTKHARTDTASSSKRNCCTKRLLGYSLYAHGLPAVMVSGTVAAAILISDGKQVGYGGASCYLSTPSLAGIVFLLPLGLIVLFNVWLFVSTFRSAKSGNCPGRGLGGNVFSFAAKRRSRAEMPGPWRHRSTVLLTLSLLTGLSCTLRLLSQAFHAPGLTLLSAMVNGTQGVLVAIVCLATRQVAHLYIRAFRSHWLGSRESAYITRPILAAPADVGAVCTPSSADGPCYFVYTRTC